MKYFLIIFIICLSIISFSQKWDTTFGNQYWDESPRDLKESYDKGYLLLGNTGSNDQGWLIKTDINGSLLWDKYLSANGMDPIFFALQQDHYGNMFIAGLVNINQGQSTSVILKLNTCGELEWCKVIYTGDYIYNSVKDMLIYNDSTLICYARHNEPDNLNNNYFYNINTINGEIRWKKSYATKNENPLIEQSAAARLYLYNDLFVAAGFCYTAYPNGDSSHFYLHPFYFGVDTLFQEKWVLSFGVNDSLRGEAWGAIPISDSIIMGFGKRRLGSISHSLLMFFDYDGNELGYNIIGNEQISNKIISNSMNDMRWINDSLLYGSIGYSDFDEVRHFCDVRVDTGGNVYSSVMADTNTGGGGISNMVKTFDDKYVITCGYLDNGILDMYLYKKNENLDHDTIYPGNYTYDSLCEEPIVSGTISLAGCDIIVNLKEVPTLDQYRNNILVNVFPNPVSKNEITFEYQNTEHHKHMELRCFNVYGELIHDEKIYQHQGESKVNVESWRSGIYIAIVYSNCQIVSNTKFLIR